MSLTGPGPGRNPSLRTKSARDKSGSLPQEPARTSFRHLGQTSPSSFEYHLRHQVESTHRTRFGTFCVIRLRGSDKDLLNTLREEQILQVVVDDSGPYQDYLALLRLA